MAGNERLRQAMATARVDVEAVAARAEVDPKTVQRWLAGRIPHARHRWRVAELLGVHEDLLWPRETIPGLGAAAGAGLEVVDAWAHRADVPVEVWVGLLDQARRHVDLLAYAMLQLPEQHPGFLDVLLEKAARRAQVRIVLGDPGSAEVQRRDDEEQFGGGMAPRIRTTVEHFRPLFGQRGIQIRFQTQPLYASIYRYDDELLVNAHLWSYHAYQSPVFHVRRGVGGLFDNYLHAFELIWERASPRTPQGDTRAPG
jgi:transcriptional regulator with XRE-family HTH domain